MQIKLSILLCLTIFQMSAVCSSIALREFIFREISNDAIKQLVKFHCAESKCEELSFLDCLSSSDLPSHFIGYNTTHLVSCFLNNTIPEIQIDNFNGKWFGIKGLNFLIIYITTQQRWGKTKPQRAPTIKYAPRYIGQVSAKYMQQCIPFRIDDAHCLRNFSIDFS